MVDEKYDPRQSLPIPTYEEATSSRPTSSHSFLGAGQSSDDAERQGLLGSSGGDGQDGRSGGTGYRHPTVESERSSLDTDLFLSPSPGGTPRASQERREIFEMDMLDPGTDNTSGRQSQIRSRINKRLTILTNTLSSLHLPFEIRLPSLSYIRSRIPETTTSIWLILIRIIALGLISLLVYVLLFSDLFGSGRMGPMGQIYDPESVRAYVQSNINENLIRDNLDHLTAYSHMAGDEGDFFLAKWVQGLFEAANLEYIDMHEYQVYLNYPKENGRRVAIIDPPELAWEAQIEEDQVRQVDDPRNKQSLVFHGHSRAGNVTGPLIYANYGSREDFKYLKDQGIDMKGAIALVKYFGTQGDRALKIKAAELAGAAGCIIYSDPRETGFVRGPTWPNGPWMPSDGVQRGAVSLMSWVIGDVLTPGWASTSSAPRNSKDNNPGLVNIPSVPLSWKDAQPLLKALSGHGEKVPTAWVGGVPDIGDWYTGDQKSPTVHLMNLQDEEEKQPIWNVMGMIKGIEQPEKMIIVGNHRDAWCFGGADPGSGTAVLLEVVRVFGELVKRGWRPLRSIVFASWDGEEYNLIGSTEYVEDNLDDLRTNAFAYINVDTAVSGNAFRASASPVFRRVLLRVLDRTADPKSNETLRSIWDAEGIGLEGLGAGSDYVAFQDMAGCSSIDLGFVGDSYPYHSCYDNFEWMTKYGDPDFSYHKVLAQVWALLILELSSEPVLPFDFTAYSASVEVWVNQLDSDIHTLAGNEATIDTSRLREAAKTFSSNIPQFEAYERQWTDNVYTTNGFESRIQAAHRRSHNTRMANFETHLLDLEEGGGLPGREQFKHIIFAPQAWSGYDEAFFPEVRDRIDEKDWDGVQKAVNKVADILDRASDKLVH